MSVATCKFCLLPINRSRWEAYWYDFDGWLACRGLGASRQRHEPIPETIYD